MNIDIAIIVGSRNDLSFMQKGLGLYKSLNIAFEVKILSAHRTPELLKEYMESAEKNGCRLYIAGAGMAAHLPGVIASQTLKPVIGVPFNASSLNGIDSLLSIAMMPPGIPVSCMGIGSSGFYNACLFALQVLSLGNPSLSKLLADQRKQKELEIIKDNETLEY